MLLFPTLLLALWGCQTANPLKVTQYDLPEERRLPPISFYGKDKSEEFTAICKRHSCQNDYNLGSSVLEGLRKSNQFRTVSYNNAQMDYAVHLAISEIDPERSAGSVPDITEGSLSKTAEGSLSKTAEGSLSKTAEGSLPKTAEGSLSKTAEGSLSKNAEGYTAGSLLSAAARMLTPVDLKRQVRAEFLVTWKNIPIAEYMVSALYDNKLSLFNLNNQLEQHVGESFVSQFIASIQTDRVFSGDTLNSKLGASDYVRDLRYPESAGEFIFAEKKTFPHPLEGAQLNYVHTMFEFDRYDIFVYPIRSVSWMDTKGSLESELASLARELEAGEEAGHHERVEILSAGDTQVITNEGVVHGRKMRLRLKTGGQEIHGYVYLFCQEDKFIRFRISYRITRETLAEPDPMAFVQAVLPGIKVPKESAFMAELRSQYKEENN